MTESLKPCPFCGGPAGVMKRAGVHQACCADPSCPANDTYDTAEEAARVWNTRPTPRAAVLAAISKIDGGKG